MSCVQFSFFLEMLQIFLFSRKCTVSRKNTSNCAELFLEKQQLFLHQFNICWLKHVDFLTWQHSYRTQSASLALQNCFFLHLGLMFSGKVSDLKISKDKWYGYHKLTLHFSSGHIHIDNKAIEGDGLFWVFFSVIFTFLTTCKGYILIV